MMARRIESGFCLIERCRRELPLLAEDFRGDSAMRAALGEVVEAAARVDDLLRRSNARLCAKTSHGEEAIRDA